VESWEERPSREASGNDVVKKTCEYRLEKATGAKEAGERKNKPWHLL
jgi:hypothetical protein